jgi:hypothetical protein
MFHILAFIWLVDQRHAFPPVIDPPAMVVSLVPPLPRQPPPSAQVRSERRQAVLARPPEPQTVRPLVIPDIDRADSGADRAAAEGFRQVLRGLVGCAPSALAGMPAEARQRCQDQLAARTAWDRGAPGPKLSFDTRGEFAANPEPYLTRKPKNGCRVRAAGDTGVSGQDGARAGIGCAFSF